MRLAFVPIVAVLVVALALRWWALDRLPGLNADETWLSVQTLELLLGREAEAATPTNNPVNPFHAVPLALVESVRGSPGVLNLRLPAALVGALLVLLVYPLMRAPLGRARALAVSLLAWSLPQHIAYARFGWDASQTPLAALLCLAAALHGRTGWMVVALLAALWIHPTNVFLVPVLAGMVTGSVLSGRRQLARRDVLWLASGVAAVGAFLLLRGAGPSYPAPGLAGLIDPGLLLSQIQGVARLLSGATVIQYIVGPLSPSALLAFDGVFGVVALGLGAIGVPRLLRARDGMALGLVAGVVATWLVLTVTAGSLPFAPGFERYAMFLTVPCCLIFACLLVPPASGEEPPVTGTLAGGIAVACLAWLAVFTLHYHVPLDARSSRSYALFSTGPVEPKAAAFDAIVSQAPEGPVRILADGYWTYWPMRYFAIRDPRITVEELRRGELEKGVTLDHPVFAVGFDDGWLTRQLARRPDALPRDTFTSRAGEPILHLWRLR